MTTPTDHLNTLLSEPEKILERLPAFHAYLMSLVNADMDFLARVADVYDVILQSYPIRDETLIKELQAFVTKTDELIDTEDTMYISKETHRAACGKALSLVCILCGILMLL